MNKPQVVERSDTELAQAASRGDEEAFSALYERHYSLAYKTAFRLSGSQSAAEDITQEVFIKVAKSINKFRAEAKFTTWLYRIIANASYDWRKKQKNIVQIQDFHLEEQSKRNVSIEESKIILQSLDTLSAKERESIVLSVFEGLSHKEIAKLSSCAETTISWRIHKAKKKLKAFFVES